MILLRAGLGRLVGISLVGSLLVFAAPAVAKPCSGHQPGGNSEVSQYLEDLPGPCGNQGLGGGNGSGDPSGGGGGGQGSQGGGPVNQLNSLGPAGVVTANLAEATSPTSGGGHNGESGSRSGGRGGGNPGGGNAGSGTATGGVPTAGTGDGSITGALKSLATGGSDRGIGTWLPILLGAIFLSGMAFAALRRGHTQ